MDSNTNPVHAGTQRLARLAAGSILYQCRIGRAQKHALDVMGNVLCMIIEALLKNASSFSSGTPSLIIYDKFEDEKLISLRRSPDFVHEANVMMDMALSCLSVSPSSFLFLTGLNNSWNPDYAIQELLEYARIQMLFGEGQKDSLKRIMEQIDGPALEKWNRSVDSLPKSIFENNGLINPMYTIVPRPQSSVQEIPAGMSSCPSSDSTGKKRPLETIAEEQA